jgi:hypothetical protein
MEQMVAKPATVGVDLKSDSAPFGQADSLCFEIDG